MARKTYRDSFVGAHISNTVAAQIAKLREKEGWTQTQLAERVGMKQSRISALEDPNYENYEIKTLCRIASTFEVGLTVRFVPLSEIVRWSTEFSEDNLVVPKFEEDRLDDAHATVWARLSNPEAFTSPEPITQLKVTAAKREAGEIRTLQ